MSSLPVLPAAFLATAAIAVPLAADPASAPSAPHSAAHRAHRAHKSAAERACTLPAGLKELSGLGASTKHPGIVYALNDSGNTNQVFAVDCSGTTGQLKATFTLGGATNTDWEAMAVGPDETGRPSILVGDIGDNFAGRAQISVYRFAEPDTLANATVSPTTFRFTYADGKHDAESLLLDPTSRQMYVASKVLGSAGKLYKAPLPPQPGQVNTLTPVRNGPTWTTDGAYSPSGTSYVLRSGGPFGPNTGYVYDAAGTKLAEVALPAQPQGETVTYADCKTLLVGSENDSQLWRVPLPAAATPGC
ncbi:hypothetical protein ACIRPT_01770 [Streptomyces sp. NPDC101227]|uniref:hypothetical protein n=1 Tax=Streptomyces sp. NPDC101227 TaxID=3366136 RepID=UPI0037F3D6F5